ncbi:MAG: hypothetical protein NVS2B8_03040 [Vulcanimicrobiaceae bacterium]
MDASGSFRVFVTDEHGERVERPDLYVASSADDLRAAMTLAVERLKRHVAPDSEIGIDAEHRAADGR